MYANSKFYVRLTHAEHGFIFYKVKYGSLCFENEFDFVFYPMESLKSWLEELVSSQKVFTQCTIENGSEALRFTFLEAKDQSVFKIMDFYTGQSFLIVPVERMQLVRTFYEAVTQFAVSPEYFPEHWEEVFLKDKLSYHFGGVTEEILLEMLLPVNRDCLIEILFKKVEWYILKQYKNRDLHFYNSFEFAKNNSQSLPLDYDEWSPKQRSELIQNWLNFMVNSEAMYRGMPLKEFRSDRVEKFLGIERLD